MRKIYHIVCFLLVFLGCLNFVSASCPEPECPCQAPDTCVADCCVPEFGAVQGVVALLAAVAIPISRKFFFKARKK